MPRFLAEIGERGGADAFDIAAIGRKFEIERQHVILGQHALDLERTHDLAQFCRNRAFAAWLQQARDLHGQRRAAGADMAASGKLERRARQRQSDRRRDGRGSACPRRRTAHRRNADRHRRPRPAGASGRRSSHRRAADRPSRSSTRVENSRSLPSGAGPSETIHHSASRQRGNAAQRRGPRRYAHFVARHFPAMTSTFSLPVRPKRSGRYMSSTLACGRT